MSDALLELPVIETAEVTPDEQVSDEVSAELSTDAGDASAESAGDGRILPQYIRNMKETDPKGYREASSLFFRDRDLSGKLKDFDLDGSKAFFEEFGGKDGAQTAIQELRTAKEEWEGVQAAIASGSPAIASRILEAAGDNRDAVALAMFTEWAKSSPEVYSAQLSGAIANTFSSQGVPMEMEKTNFYLQSAADVLASIPEVMSNPIAVRAMQQLSAQFQKIDGTIKRFSTPQPMTTQPSGAPKLDAREQAISSREEKLFMDDYMGDVTRTRESAVAGFMKDFIAKAPADTDKRDAAMSLAINDVKKRMSGDKDFLQKLGTLEAKRDKAGALKLIAAREGLVLKEAAEKAGRIIYGSTASPKPATPAPERRESARVTPIRPKDKFDTIWAS